MPPRPMLGALALLALSACGPAPDSLRSTLPAGDAALLLPQGSLWQVESIEGFTLPAHNGILLRRDAQGFTGTTACNRLRAPLSQQDRSIDIGPVMLTRRACLGHAAAQEAAFVSALDQVDGVAATADAQIALTRGGIVLMTLSSATKGGSPD